ncbi:HAD superfamily hydrolase (TIGR01549 family) [Kushneria sinocarnis]|uniref:HAD superfamily hydrolase (TIGR01549 family) n=1 Tax=Kushneria sinocarnis TaxID=595502 RepID=A0A420WWX5_9GAMM|nr:HAD-IA family hydrolase [Kushneria sinocarnis]RKR04251.1 HAD superfamily hydrolase (TIGR01549 family) [Kushneria sinocarnis]
MPEVNIKKAVFITNLSVDMGIPSFRAGAYEKFLMPLSENIKKAYGVECKDSAFIISEHAFKALGKEAKERLVKFNRVELVDIHEEGNSFLKSDYFLVGDYNKKDVYFDQAKNLILNMLGDWCPDIIFSWEYPVNFLRKIYPEALVVDLMPGPFMRPPFPRTLSVDINGLYKDSSFNKNACFPSDCLVREEKLSEFYELRSWYKNYFESRNVKEIILSQLTGAENFEEFWLVPLQISSYFGFYENCSYKNQFEFLVDVLSNAPDHVGVIVTQYVSGFVSERAVNDKNIDFLRERFPNFLYSSAFEKLDNISQYIAPWADATVSISSTIGLQAKFFGKALISPSRSHLSSLGSDNFLSRNEISDREFASSFFYNFVLEDHFLNNSYFLKEYIDGLFRGRKGSTFFEINSILFPYIELSSFNASDKKLKALDSSKYNLELENFKKIEEIFSDKEAISFDVFDTLVRRTVFRPEDVFFLMQKHIKENTERFGFLPRQVIERFAVLRHGFERQLREKQDIALTQNPDLPEEIRIEDVYKLFLNELGLESSYSETLVQLEQDIELQTLKPRKIGNALFKKACEKNKKIIITSDFIHSYEFVKKVLITNGYRFDELYVSSREGHKKHSGSLFEKIIENAGIAKGSIVHVGDNLVGDYEKANQSGLQAINLPSSRERFYKEIKKRPFDKKVIDNSFVLRTSAGLYCERFFSPDFMYKDKEYKFATDELMNSPYKFGYLALGPVVLEFSKWILNKSKEMGVKQVLFFSRDCYMAYKVASLLVEQKNEYQDIDLKYVRVSRQALTALNIDNPIDCFDIRIDDYSRANSLASLLTNRFKIDLEEIEGFLLEKWNIKDTSVLVKDVNYAAIYGLVYDYLVKNWNSWDNGNSKNKESLKKYLESLDIDASLNTSAVDFGYKGSTHKALRFFFEEKFIPLFFMSYINENADDPIENAHCFLFKNLNSKQKEFSFLLSHNLFVETLFNEPVGSLISYDPSGLSLESGITLSHENGIKQVHEGATMFADDWISDIEPLYPNPSFEINSSIYFLEKVLCSPSLAEAKNFIGLKFDNTYAGADSKYIVTNNGVNDLWKEGKEVIQRSKNKKQGGSINDSVKKPNQSWRILNNHLNINGVNFPKRVYVARALHSSSSLQAFSQIAFPGRDVNISRVDNSNINKFGKYYAFYELAKRNGGIMRSELNILDKFSLFFKRFSLKLK